MSLRKLTAKERAQKAGERFRKENPDYNRQWRHNHKSDGYKEFAKQLALLQDTLLDAAVGLEQVKELAKKISLH